MSQLAGVPYTTGRIFMVADSNSANFQDIDELYKNHWDGEITRHSTIDAAVSACTASRGDIVLVAP